MPDQSFEFDVLGDLLNEAQTVGALAGNEKIFTQAYEAFRSQDRKTFQAILAKLRLTPRCRLVCEWIRSKECVFLCLRLCGPPTAADKPPDPRQLAEAIVRITEDEKAVRELAAIVEKGDAAAFKRFVDVHKLGPFCHFFCHWVCVVRFRLVCRWLCGIDVTERPNLAAELTAAGHALRVLLGNKAAFDQAAAGAQAGDPDKVRNAIGAADLIPFCHLICEWFCSWRCVFVCMTLCRQFPLPTIEAAGEVKEAFTFAQATQKLAAQPLQLERLSAAVGAGDVKTYSAIVTELKLQRFCVQLCHWICFLRCQRYCILVCPPPSLFPVFTSIGGYDYIPDVHSALGGNGRTIGDDRAFFNTLRLNGILTQTLGGQPMEYRFETRPTDAAGNPLGAGTWSPVLPAQIARTEIGHWERFNFITMTIETKKYTVNGTVGPNELVAPIAPDGWIKVPQENNWLSAAGAFGSNGNMIELVTQSLQAFPAQNETGTVGGGAPHHPLAQDVYYGMRMRIRQVGVPGSETSGGTCVHVAIADTLYDNITRHPYWNGGLQPAGQLGVAVLDIAELKAHPCSEITNSLTVQFCAAHPNLGGVSISMSGPGGPYPFNLPAAGVGEWFGTATIPAPPPSPPGWTLAGLKPCAYIVTLQVDLLLTNGDGVPNPLYDQIAFCKK